MSAPGTVVVSPSEATTQPAVESLPSLLSRLGDDVMELFNAQFALLKVEAREEANAFMRSTVMIGIGAVIASMGFALVNVAAAFAVSMLFTQANLSQPARYALGFVVTGAFYLVIGGIVLAVMKNRIANRELLPQRTVEELRKDKEWLKNEL